MNSLTPKNFATLKIALIFRVAESGLKSENMRERQFEPKEYIRPRQRSNLCNKTVLSFMYPLHATEISEETGIKTKEPLTK